MADFEYLVTMLPWKLFFVFLISCLANSLSTPIGKIKFVLSEICTVFTIQKLLKIKMFMVREDDGDVHFRIVVNL